VAFFDDETSAYGSQPVEGYVITLGATVLRLSNQQVTQMLDGANNFTPVSGLTRRRIVRKEIGASGSELEIRMAASYLQAFGPGKQPNPFTVVLTRYQPGGSQRIFTGHVSQTRIEDNEIVLRCVSNTERLMARKCPSFALGPRCGRTLYDLWCRVDRDDHTFTPDVDDVDGLMVEVSSVDLRPDGYFAGGEFLWSGEKRTIMTQVGTTLTIDYPFATALVVGQAVTLHPGCDKSLATCISKYDNHRNHQAAPFQPDQNIHVLGVNGMRVFIQ
jgi:hypothetical protein